MKKISSILFMLLYTLIIQCQADSSRVRRYFEAGVHYGFIIPHAEEIEPVSHTNPVGFDLSYNRMNTSYESWSIFNTFWSSGIRFSYFNFRNPEELGSAMFVTAFAEPVISHGNRYVFSIGGGAGLSFHTKKFDREDNPRNQFFSTRSSFPIYVYSKLRYHLTDNFQLFLAASYNHISNGGIRQPNFGMNFPTFSGGLNYNPSYSRIPGQYAGNATIIPGISYVFQVLTSYRVVDETNNYPEQGYFATGIHARASKQLTSHYGLNAGGEIIFDAAIRETIRRSGKETDYKRAALTAGQDISFGKTRFTQYFGFYIYAPYKARNLVYQKYELWYMFNQNFGAGVFLKAHAHVAELLGVQINILFTGKRNDNYIN